MTSGREDANRVSRKLDAARKNGRSRHKENGLHPAEEVGSPLFANYQQVEEKVGESSRTVKRGLSVQSITEKFSQLTKEGLRCVWGRLFAEGQRCRPLWLDGTDDLFAWIARHLPSENGNRLKWAKGEDKVSQAVFHAHLRQVVPQFQSLELMPHWPQLTGACYMHPSLSGGDGAKLRELLWRFSPATELDRQLLLSLFLTMFWGGRPGQRPSFLIESDEQSGASGRGVGKTSAAEIFASLAGGYISVRPNDDIDKLTTRLLSPQGLELRVALLDNVKTLRFSWADLEALVTAETISGRSLYVGEGRRPNTLIWIITLNTASLSKDMAQRMVIIRLARAKYDPAWKEATEAFIGRHRWEVIGDILALLKSAPSRLKRYSRWASWEQGVLAHVGEPSECQKVIAERQREVDGDQAEADLVREAFEQELKRRHHNPERERVWIPSAEAARWLAISTGENRPTNKASTYLGGLGIAELRKSDRGMYGRGWIWTGAKAGQDCQTSRLGDF